MRQEKERDRTRAGEKEDQTAQESKPDPSSNASVRSYGFSLERQIVTVADREDRVRHPRARYHTLRQLSPRASWCHAPPFTSPLRRVISRALRTVTKERSDHPFRGVNLDVCLREKYAR